ncbi:DNA-binding transcriptional regulator, MarR family [Ligilactobacillus sp. WC1T17]|uniref:DNA-binding transcriptional regulator, MarR family n=1 Tax=Ligilactobacillus ruminis TaxID=1623 RepID=A0ABY1ACQ7_9LACO|nr:DNA-binding transcriptional regulator, MarR family [Ligilactobacillus ruminis]
MMNTYEIGGYLVSKIQHYNGRLFNRYLTEDGRAVYNAEQGKILSALWEQNPQTVSMLAPKTGLAKSSLTLMLKKLEQQGLITLEQDESDKRKRIVVLTTLGKNQQLIGDEVSEKLGRIFYQGFSETEIAAFEAYLKRIETNLVAASRKEEEKPK